MSSVKCFKCGRINNDGVTNCEVCGETLLTGQEYEDKLRELREYYRFQNNFSAFMLVFRIVLLLAIYPLMIWISKFLLLAKLATVKQETFFLAAMKAYVEPILLLLLLFAVILPWILGRRKFVREHGWTGEKMLELKRDFSLLPKQTLKKDILTGYSQKSKVSINPVPLAIIVWIIAGMFYMNQYTDIKPLNVIFSYLQSDQNPNKTISPNANSSDLKGSNKVSVSSSVSKDKNTGVNQPSSNTTIVNGSAQQVKGTYIHKYEYGDKSNPSSNSSTWSLNGGGTILPASSEQTWAYTFTLGPDGIHGTFEVFLDGALQYEGKKGSWYQVGNVLTMTYPELQDMNIPSKTFQFKVSNDGNVILMGNDEYRKVGS